MGNRQFWRWCYSVQENMLLLVLSLWKSCPGYSSFSRSFSSSLYATLQLFHIMAVLWHWVLWCCTGNASLVNLLNMSVFQLVWVWPEGFNTHGDGCKSQWPLLSVLVAVPHNSPQGADAVINCLMQMNSIIEQFFLVGDGKHPSLAKGIQSSCASFFLIPWGFTNWQTRSERTCLKA
jgi:hypothetical protein